MPEPVGAEISTCSPVAIAGQACAWPRSGLSNERVNQSRTCGVNDASGSEAKRPTSVSRWLLTAIAIAGCGSDDATDKADDLRTGQRRRRRSGRARSCATTSRAASEAEIRRKLRAEADAREGDAAARPRTRARSLRTVCCSTHRRAPGSPHVRASPSTSAVPARLARGEARPNIVVLMTDDQTLESMSVMPKTRRLIGAQGTTFTRSFANYSLCCPSRSTLYTGQYAHNHGVLNNTLPNGGFTGSTPPTGCRSGSRRPATGPCTSASSSTATAATRPPRRPAGFRTGTGRSTRRPTATTTTRSSRTACRAPTRASTRPTSSPAAPTS